MVAGRSWGGPFLDLPATALYTQSCRLSIRISLAYSPLNTPANVGVDIAWECITNI